MGKKELIGVCKCFKFAGGRVGLNNNKENFFMGKKGAFKSTKFLVKNNHFVVSSDIRYNADTTCVSATFPHDMCSTSLEGIVEVIYKKR